MRFQISVRQTPVTTATSHGATSRPPLLSVLIPSLLLSPRFLMSSSHSCDTTLPPHDGSIGRPWIPWITRRWFVMLRWSGNKRHWKHFPWAAISFFLIIIIYHVLHLNQINISTNNINAAPPYINPETQCNPSSPFYWSRIQSKCYYKASFKNSMNKISFTWEYVLLLQKLQTANSPHLAFKWIQHRTQNDLTNANITREPREDREKKTRFLSW